MLYWPGKAVSNSLRTAFTRSFDRTEMERGVPVVDGVVVPDDESAVHDLPEGSGAAAGDPRRDHIISRPEEIYLRIENSPEGFEICPGVGCRAAAGIISRAEDEGGVRLREFELNFGEESGNIADDDDGVTEPEKGISLSQLPASPNTRTSMTNAPFPDW